MQTSQISIRAFIVAPVVIEGEGSGVIRQESTQPGEWTDDDIATIAEHADLLTLMLNNGKYYSMMKLANASPGLQPVTVLSAQIDGELQVDNGKGTTFTITIPEGD